MLHLLYMFFTTQDQQDITNPLKVHLFMKIFCEEYQLRIKLQHFISQLTSAVEILFLEHTVSVINVKSMLIYFTCYV
jgi:hypothetical protein